MIDWTKLLGGMGGYDKAMRIPGPLGNTQPMAQQQAAGQKTPWLNREGMGGLSKGELLMAGMGMLSGRNLQEGFGNSAQIAYGGMERKRKEQEKQEKSAALAKAMGMMQSGDAPGAKATLAGLYPDAVGGAMAQQAFAPPPVDEPYTLAPGARRFGPDGQEIAANPVAEKPEGPMSTMGKLAADLNAGRITPEQYQIEIARMNRPGTTVNVGGGDESWKYGKPSEGWGLVTDPNSPTGARMERIPGGPAASEAASNAATSEKKAGNVNFTVGTLIDNYSTLRNNKALKARGNTALDNAAAIYSGTGIGKAQDALGGEIGNIANDEARNNIKGISMNALMQMISASDVSAKAMDSDAEMKAWLGAIKDDNYEAALTKLYVLDKSFGDGTALEKAYADGTVDLGTYQYITNRMNSDPMVMRMAAKADRYAALGGAVGGRENMTQSEISNWNDADEARLRELEAKMGAQ